MFKLDLEKPEEPEIKLLTSVGSYNNKRIIENLILLLLDYAKAFDCVDHNKQWKILRDGRLSYLPPEKSVCRSKSNRTGHVTTNWFQIGKEVHQVTLLI